MSSKPTMPLTKKTTKKSASGPRATRPRMPKGYAVPKTERGMLPWTVTRKILEGARSYWLVTIDPDGKPHLVGQWGAWIDERWYFEGGEDTKWARNVGREPRIAMGAESGTTAVMIEGRAARVPSVDRPTAERITKQYGAKYGRSRSSGTRGLRAHSDEGPGVGCARVPAQRDALPLLGSWAAWERSDPRDFGIGDPNKVVRRDRKHRV